MPTNLLKSISYPKKSQVVVYIFSVMATLVLTAFIIIEVGKTAKDKTYSDNAADAGALATASVMATGFNYIAEKNGTHQNDHNKKESDKEVGDAGDGQGEIPSDMKKAMDQVQQKIDQYVQQAKNATTCPAAIEPAMRAIDKAEIQIQNCDELLADLKAYNEKQREDMKNQADNLYGESGNNKNYYDTAISQGYKNAFQNSGISHRLGKATQDMYTKVFLPSLEPGSVQSGEPKTFFWVDGAGRVHMVTVIVQTEDVNNWTVVTAKDDTSVTEQKVNEAKQKYREAIDQHFNIAITSYYQPCPGDWACVLVGFCLNPIGWCVNNPQGDARMESGLQKTREGHEKLKDAINGLNENDDNKQRSQSSDLDDETPKYIKDIHHSRTDHAMCFQFHMGSPIKSMYGDIDTMTFYPPVQSSAIATFNYTGEGEIDGKNAKSSHEAGLNASF